MRAALLTLFLGPTMALGQVFYTEEEFYRYLENRQRMALIELQARQWAAEQAETQRQTAREREHERVMQAVQDELDRRALENIKWLQRRREDPYSFSLE